MEILGPSPQPSFLRLLAILLGEAIECTVLSPNPSHDAVFSPGYPTAGVCYSPLLFSNGFLKLPLSIRLLCAEQNCVCVCVHVHLVAHLVVFNSLQPHGLQPTRLLCPWDSPGKNTGVGCHSLIQGILPTQRSNLRLLQWQVDSLPLRRLGS